MKVCFMCDMHLPFDTNALQYSVWEWSLEDIKRKKPDCILYAGDATCDGNPAVYKDFVRKMQSLGIPFLYIPGNSDLRCADSRLEISTLSSPCENTVNGIKIFAINDCNTEISDEQFETIEKADDTSIVFMHHPEFAFSQACREKLARWRETHKDTMLFYGHLHESRFEGTDVSLQALDPDKAIEENPCITYYDTETRELQRVYYECPVPVDFYEQLGISVYDTVSHIELATRNGLKNLELRPNCLNSDREELLACIAKWRANGGENLCLHLPEVSYQKGEIISRDIDQFLELAEVLRIDRFTQHVPLVSLDIVKADPTVLEKISDYLARKFNAIQHDIVIGVENMHMTAKDQPNDCRRFGYTPEECIDFMNCLQQKCRHKVGINFDIGHARNNAPFSQKYQISTWLSLVGQYIVGYHLHQVTLTEGKFNNHMPITHIYGKLISYASLFRCWQEGRINKAPLIFEMRPQGAYETTLMTFMEQKTVRN